MGSPVVVVRGDPETGQAAGAPPDIVSRFLRLQPREASFARRGFHSADAAAQGRLESVGEVFLRGYGAALELPPGRLAGRLGFEQPEMQGFAYEGAAMGLALVGILLPWRFRHFQSFRRGDGDRHRYMVHVGAGWALAALRAPLRPFLRRLDPLLQWLAVDGFGFYHGYFHFRRTIQGHEVPRRLRGYERRTFDQGLGRAAWFAYGADVAAVARALSLLPEARRHDVWSGVGLACAYAGGAPQGALRALRESAGAHRAALAQGACFAAGARQRAGNQAIHTDAACLELCDLDSAAAADLTEETLEGLTPAPGSYEEWRLRIQARFAPGEVLMG